MPKRITSILFMIVSLFSYYGLAQGAGLILYEINSPLTGTASAGWAALAEDASTAFTNPAGMTRLDRSQLLVGAQPLSVTTEFDPGSASSVIGTDGTNSVLQTSPP